jgi:hypothetical protein
MYHANKQSWLLSCSSYASITDDSDGETSSKTGEADRQTCSKLRKTLGERHACFY